MIEEDWKMADNNFKGTVDALFQGIDGVVSSKTVVGDAIHIGETIIPSAGGCVICRGSRRV